MTEQYTGEKQQTSTIKSILKRIMVVVLLAVSAFSFYKFYLYVNYPIKTVRIYGTRFTEHKQVQHTLTPMVSRGFFAINMDEVREKLLEMPWVSDAVVRRVWPETINVNIIEKKPIAYWNEKDLISDLGELFSPDKAPEINFLPNLHGPLGKELIVLQYYLRMNQLLEPIARKVASLRLTPYATWHIRLDNGVELRVDHQQVLTRLSRFVKVYTKIIGNHSSEIEYVDLRYSNGVAVKWKKTQNS